MSFKYAQSFKRRAKSPHSPLKTFTHAHRFPASSGFRNQFLFCFKTFHSTFQRNQFLDQTVSCKLDNGEYDWESTLFGVHTFYLQNRVDHDYRPSADSIQRLYAETLCRLSNGQVAIRQTGFSSLITHRPCEPDARG